MPTLTRRTLLAAGAAALAPALIGAAPRKRNVLFIASDDLNNSLGCYGNPLVQSPNIDRLARMGVRFDRSYCQFPFCGPSRASLMTGMAPDKTRVWDLQANFRTAQPDAITLPQLFRQNGYFTARAGKIYHYGVPDDIGTNGMDDKPSWQQVVNPNGVDHTKEEPLLTVHTPTRAIGSSLAFHASAAPDNLHTDGLLAEAVIGMMEQHRSEPFFIGAGFYRPHVPFIAPSKYFDLYPLEKIEARPFKDSDMTIAPEWAFFTKPANWGLSVLQRREAIRAYYASISFMDAQVGRLLDTLDRLKLTENTTIVFWGDNGYQLGEHGQWMKQTVFEAAARVPVIIGGAGVSARGRGCGRTVELLDLYPTLADLCNLSAPPGQLAGKSLRPLLKNPAAAWDRPAISQVLRTLPASPSRPTRVMGYSLRNERYRYSQWNEGALGEELYDYQNDPAELHDLSRDERHLALKASLRDRLIKIIAARQ